MTQSKIQHRRRAPSTKFDELDVDEYRRHAQDMRTAAETADSPEARAECLMVARAWDDFVDELVRSGLGSARALN